MVQAGARPMTSLQYLLELQRDWARSETYDHTNRTAMRFGGAYGIGISYARAVLGAAGLKYEDFDKVEYLPFGESVELMKNRQLDATLISAGLGVAAIRDVAAAISR